MKYYGRAVYEFQMKQVKDFLQGLVNSVTHMEQYVDETQDFINETKDDQKLKIRVEFNCEAPEQKVGLCLPEDDLLTKMFRVDELIRLGDKGAFLFFQVAAVVIPSFKIYIYEIEGLVVAIWEEDNVKWRQVMEFIKKHKIKFPACGFE